MARKRNKRAGEEGGGAPAWVMTFADLMSLLMCFFVLLLSFSEMDAAKYKQVAGSMKFAFGVQREVKSNESPKGVTIIAKEFTPGKPQPTFERVLKQQTTDDTKDYIEVLEAAEKGVDEESDEKRKGKNAGQDGDGSGTGKDGDGTGKDGEDARAREEAAAQAAREVARKVMDQAERLEVALQHEISEGLVNVKTLEDGVLIKVREHGSFPSGFANLDPEFTPVLDKIAGAIVEASSRVVVAGHSDNVPINTGRYPSNWMLSAARATSVVQSFIDRGLIARERLEVRAHADTVPIAPNSSARSRAMNRRVEIFIGVQPGHGRLESEPMEEHT